MTQIKQVQCIDQGGAIAVTDEFGMTHRFHSVWLRDNSPDPETRSTGNGQKLVSLSQLPGNISVSRAELNDEGDVLLQFQPEDKEVTFSSEWLTARSYDTAELKSPGWLRNGIETWDAGLAAVPDGDFKQVSSDHNALRDWLDGVSRYGFAKLSHGPVESGALLKVAELFGYVRETNYGKYFEVRTEVSPSNLAYTGLGLQAHTDNPYRDPVPTMQILYCLESTAKGGDSLVVDGYRAAQRLRQESPAEFDLLAKYCARFEYAGSDDVLLQSRKPVFELAPDGELVAVRFNNRSSAAITDVPYDVMPDYYRALRHMSEIVDDPGMAVKFRLQPGECFIVDNMRVLHARTEYSGTGMRWLQGCYPDRDGLYSKLALLNLQLQNIEN